MTARNHILFTVLFAICSVASSNGAEGMDGNVYAITVSGSEVYVGGNFTTAGGVSASRIAKWNGSSWSALGSGLNSGFSVGEVKAIAVSGTDVYVGGHFSTAGGVAVNNIAKWNGSSWSALGSGVNNDVYAVAVSGGDVYVGGEFTTAGGVSASKIAKWNGSSWSAVGSGVGDGIHGSLWVSAMTVSGGNVYVGGNFTTAGGVPASFVAKWNGSNWSALGSGMNNYVYAITISGSDLYAGGEFTTAGGGNANRIAKWNGSSWSTLGTGIGAGVVFAVGIGSGSVYVGGNFSYAGGVVAENIAKWNGSTWSRMATGTIGEFPYMGTDWPVFAISVNGTDLYMGGMFTLVGDLTALGIAKWHGSVWSTLGGTATAPTITTTSPLLSGTVGTAYNQALQATGGTTPYTWTKVSGSLPAGLNLSSGGMISGTPGATTTANFRVRVTGANALYSEKNFSLTVNSNALIPAAGTYQGLLYDSSGGIGHQSSGFLSVRTTAKGTFSAKLQLAGKSYSFIGRFSAEGSFSTSLRRKGPNPISVELQIDPEANKFITGQISDGSWTAELLASRATFNSRTNPTLHAGKYTLVVPGSDNCSTEPGGDGFGTVRVDSSGNVVFSGILGDGTRVLRKASISNDGQWPLYAPLYSGKGCIIGRLAFTNQLSSDIVGVLNWFKPEQARGRFYRGGFACQTEAIGSRYIQPPKGTPVLDFDSCKIWLQYGNLAGSFTNHAAIGRRNTLIGTNKLSLVITPSSGLFRGRVTNPTTGKPIHVRGAVLQKSDVGAGYFLGTDQSGCVYLEPD